MNRTENTNKSIDKKLINTSIFYNAAYVLLVAYLIFRKDWLFYIGAVATLAMVVFQLLAIFEFRRLSEIERQPMKKRIRYNTISTVWELLVYVAIASII